MMIHKTGRENFAFNSPAPFLYVAQFVAPLSPLGYHPQLLQAVNPIGYTRPLMERIGVGLSYLVDSCCLPVSLVSPEVEGRGRVAEILARIKGFIKS